MKKQRGLSFIELIFVLSVAAILISLGIPGFLGSIRNSEMATASNAFVGALHSARAEAVKTRSLVTVCPGVRTGATPSCDPNGNDLLVFVNAANDSSYDDPADTLVRATPWLKENMTVSAPALPGYITFTAAGATRAINGDPIFGTLLLCGPSGEDHARVITLSPTGRPTVQHHRDATNPPACPAS